MNQGWCWRFEKKEAGHASKGQSRRPVALLNVHTDRERDESGGRREAAVQPLPHRCADRPVLGRPGAAAAARDARKEPAESHGPCVPDLRSNRIAGRADAPRFTRRRAQFSARGTATATARSRSSSFAAPSQRWGLEKTRLPRWTPCSVNGTATTFVCTARTHCCAAAAVALRRRIVLPSCAAAAEPVRFAPRSLGSSTTMNSTSCCTAPATTRRRRRRPPHRTSSASPSANARRPQRARRSAARTSTRVATCRCSRSCVTCSSPTRSR
jgi:hypothetical protein